MKDRDYQPNILASSLVTGHSYLIGLIVPDLIHPFFAEIAKALSQVIRPRGYSLIISSSDEDAGLESQELRQLLARQLDALIIASTALSGDQFDQLAQRGPPYVLIDRNFPGSSSNFVGIDDVAADFGCRPAHTGRYRHHWLWKPALRQCTSNFSIQHRSTQSVDRAPRRRGCPRSH